MFVMKHCLSQKDIEELKAQHKRERDRRIYDRIKAVLLYNLQDKFRFGHGHAHGHETNSSFTMCIPAKLVVLWFGSFVC